MIHSISTLCYRLLDAAAQLEPLRVLATRTIDWHDWRVTFVALGASHAVCLDRDGLRLTELLTCLPPRDAAPPLLESAADLPAERCLSVHGLVCRVRLQPYALSEGELFCPAFTVEDRLEVGYPALPDGQTPVTRIAWRVEARTLTVETIHTYPEEGRGVRSVTEFICEEEQ